MEYSDTLQWFFNIWWDEQERFVDCIVDVTKTEGGRGYFVIELNENLKIHNLGELQSLSCIYNIIGKAVRFDSVL